MLTEISRTRISAERGGYAVWNRYLRAGWKAADNAKALAAVNVLLGLVNIDRIMRVLAFDGVHIGFKVSLPNPTPTVWDFVEPPSITRLFFPHSWLVVGLALTLAEAAIWFFYLRLLAAQGFGIEPVADFARFLDLAAYALINLAIAAIIAVSGVAALVLFLAFIVIYYFIFIYIYAAPYIVVLKNSSLPQALAESFTMARSQRYLEYTLAYAIVVLLASPVMTLITVNMRLFGIIIGSVAGGALGLWLAASTMAMILEGTETPQPQQGRALYQTDYRLMKAVFPTLMLASARATAGIW
jgi:hypothetical protein